MNVRSLVIAVSLVFAMATLAGAVPAGRSLTFDRSKEGPVVFNGDRHSKSWYDCTKCHTKGMFPKMKKGSTKITMKAINDGKLCGLCHDGETSFRPEGNCGKCHKK
jgi:c(7)-type cytochrome triheme protein